MSKQKNRPRAIPDTSQYSGAAISGMLCGYFGIVVDDFVSLIEATRLKGFGYILRTIDKGITLGGVDVVINEVRNYNHRHRGLPEY